MKKIYSDKLINDYIYGNDIEEYDIEKLEADPIFMMQVIDKTNDKKMYEFCENEVKCDYEFVKFMIYKFKNDKNFIVKIAEDYLSRHKYNEEKIDVNCAELNIIMENLLSHSKNEYFNKFIVSNKALYNKLSIELIALYQKDSDFKKDRDFGLGFYYLQYIFENRHVILDYYAKEYIEEIFYRNQNCNFEKLIHKVAKNKEEISGKNINSFIINYVSKFDSNLSWYLSCHTELLEKVKKDIKRIYNTWDGYVRCNNSRKVDIFQSYVDNLFEAAKTEPSYTSTQLIEYIIRKMNLDDVFNDNLSYASFRLSVVYSDKDYDGDLLDSNNVVDISFCNQALKKAQDIFMDEDLRVKDEYIKDEVAPIKTKMIKFNFNNEE